MSDYILVRSVLPDDQVALWERDPRHPNGEVWVAGETVVSVSPTAAVLSALSRNAIVVVGEDSPADATSEVLPDGDDQDTFDLSTETVSGALDAVTDGDDQDTFDLSTETVSGVLDAVTDGKISVADALAAEVAGRNRKSLIAQLQDMLPADSPQTVNPSILSDGVAISAIAENDE